MGSLSIPWLSNFFDAACGKLPSFKSIEPPIKVIYPSKSYVEASISGGGTIFFTRNYWFNQSFPKQLIYKYVSKTPRGVSHAKIIAAKDSKEDIKWAYIGSHNFTSSAWGNMASLKTCSKLTITNYETGLVFLYNEADHEDLVQYQKPQVFTRSDMPWSQTFD